MVPSPDPVPKGRFGGDGEIREVWRWNFGAEFDQLLAAAAAASQECDSDGAIIALDTEFPGFLTEEPSNASRTVRYQVLRENVDILTPIQVGIAVSSSTGTLYGAWSFNLEFDTNVHLYTEASINFLTEAGINFPRHAVEGIDPAVLGKKLANSPLVNGRRPTQRRIGERPQWITFSGWYDYGYLVKLLTGWALPQDVTQFDKLIATFCPKRSELRDSLGVRGSLDSLARERGIARKGSPHTAGSDAFATLELFLEVEKVEGRLQTTAPGRIPPPKTVDNGNGNGPVLYSQATAPGVAGMTGPASRMWEEGAMVPYDNSSWDGQDSTVFMANLGNGGSWEDTTAAAVEAMQQQIGAFNSPLDLLNIPGAQFQLAWGPAMPSGGGPLATTPVQTGERPEASWAMVVAPVTAAMPVQPADLANQALGHPHNLQAWNATRGWGMAPGQSQVVGVMQGPVMTGGPVIWGTAVGPAVDCRPPAGNSMPEIALCSVQVG